jgi:hypothetical protein
MKYLTGLSLAAFLLWPGLAAAQDLSGSWLWNRIAGNLGKWDEGRGNADVEYSGGKFAAHLRDDSDKSVHYELAGTLNLGRLVLDAEGGGLQKGVITVKSKTIASDAHDLALQGTYRKFVNDRQWRPSAGTSEEYIVLTDGVNVVTLYRRTK